MKSIKVMFSVALYVWGFVRDLNDQFFLLEGQLDGKRVEYTVYPVDETTFNRKPFQEDIKRILQ